VKVIGAAYESHEEEGEVSLMITRHCVRFDCKPCEMHVVGRRKKSVVHQRQREMAEVPMQFHRARPPA
jgi:23S rRNA 5-hydroxycytidine C2501 synthase